MVTPPSPSWSLHQRVEAPGAPALLVPGEGVGILCEPSQCRLEALGAAIFQCKQVRLQIWLSEPSKALWARLEDFSEIKRNIFRFTGIFAHFPSYQQDPKVASSHKTNVDIIDINHMNHAIAEAVPQAVPEAERLIEEAELNSLYYDLFLARSDCWWVIVLVGFVQQRGRESGERNSGYSGPNDWFLGTFKKDWETAVCSVLQVRYFPIRMFASLPTTTALHRRSERDHWLFIFDWVFRKLFSPLQKQLSFS